MIESKTFTINEVVDNLSRNEEVDRVAHQKYVDKFSNNLEVQNKTKEDWGSNDVKLHVPLISVIRPFF